MENKAPTTNPSKTPIILLVLGLAIILIAQTMDSKIIDYRQERYVDNNTKKIVQYGGIGLLVIGGVLFASSFKTQDSNNSATKQNPDKFNAAKNETTEQQLEKLNALRQKELITDEEFINKKSELLSKL